MRLTDLMDPNLKVEGDETAAVARVRAAVEPPMMVALAVVGYKRRLGKAGSSELAADKRTGRRAAQCLLSVMELVEQERLDWNTVREAVDADHRAAAAVLDWKVWLPEQAAVMRREAQWCATWVIQVNIQCRILKRIAFRMDGASERLTELSGLVGV